uniref:Uncharacterized protein n=1 Tax=Arundo donax TaxID=35708 RepID=A0A0A9B059_ARUDO
MSTTSPSLIQSDIIWHALSSTSALSPLINLSPGNNQCINTTPRSLQWSSRWPRISGRDILSLSICDIPSRPPQYRSFLPSLINFLLK